MPAPTRSSCPGVCWPIPSSLAQMVLSRASPLFESMAQPNPIPPSSRYAPSAPAERPFLDPASASSSSSSKAAGTPRTLNELYFGAMERCRSRPVAVRAKRRGEWFALSYGELAGRVQDLSLGLLELGLKPGDRVAILSETRPEWAIADYACLTACCTDVPIYPTLPVKQIEYNLRDSGAAAVFVSTRQQLEKVLSVRDRLPALRHMIALEDDARAGGVLALDQVYTTGRSSRSRRPGWQADALKVRPDDLATLIYTSGTTG